MLYLNGYKFWSHFNWNTVHVKQAFVQCKCALEINQVMANNNDNNYQMSDS